MNKTDNLVRENIKNLIPYSSARDEYDGSIGIFLDANENPYGSVNRYPDPHHRKLKSAVSKLKGLPPANIFFGNGSDEIIDLLFRIFCNPGIDKSLTFIPTYGMYEVTAAVNNIHIIKVPLDDNFDINIKGVSPYLDDEKLKLIFICSPNNPTGNSFNRKTIIDIIENFRGVVIIDEAYIDFSSRESLIHMTGKYRNLVVMQTFSKAWGAAAIRIGMAFADPLIINYLYRVKPPYNISTINQAEALRRLENPDKYLKQIVSIKSERNRMAKALSGLQLTKKVYDSDANFLLVKVSNANLIYKKLITRNIIVRNRSSVVDNCLRITVGTKSENKMLLEELKRISL